MNERMGDRQRGKKTDRTRMRETYTIAERGVERVTERVAERVSRRVRKRKMKRSRWEKIS